MIRWAVLAKPPRAPGQLTFLYAMRWCDNSAGTMLRRYNHAAIPAPMIRYGLKGQAPPNPARAAIL
jgi:hypothetical protein